MFTPLSTKNGMNDAEASTHHNVELAATSRTNQAWNNATLARSKGCVDPQRAEIVYTRTAYTTSILYRKVDIDIKRTFLLNGRF